VYTTDWNDRNKAEDWRRAWAAYCNTALRINGHDAVLDHRSYARQGVEQVPTVHLGVAATQMERKGIRTERGDQNREIAITNQQIRQLRARINKLSDWLKEEAENPTPPTLYDVFTEILNREGRSKLTNLKNAAEILAFLQNNGIVDVADFDKKVNAMHRNRNSTSDNLKKVERRIKTLKEHLVESGHYKEHRSLRRQYDRLYSEYTAAKKETGLFADRKAKKALEAANDFYESNRTGLTLFDAAERYLREHMQKHFDPKKLPPIGAWEKELASKLAEKDALYRDYYKLKDDTAKIEKIQRSVKEILHSGEPHPGKMPTRNRDVEL
jgi:hypothetical protein